MIASLLAPLLLGLVVHGVCIRTGVLAFLAIPVDRGAQFRGRPLFGANKTWRGIVTVALGTAAGFLVAVRLGISPPRLARLGVLPLLGLGFATGAAAMLSELPNSFLKRQLDIAPGKATRGITAALFWLYDQVDVLLGAWLVYGAVVRPTWSQVLWSVGVFALSHQAISIVGYFLGMRTSAR